MHISYDVLLQTSRVIVSKGYVIGEQTSLARQWNSHILITWMYEGLTLHYNDVIISAMAYQITSRTIIYSTVYSDRDQRNIKAPRHWPLCGEFTGDFPAHMASNAENVSICWRHYGQPVRIPFKRPTCTCRSLITSAMTMTSREGHGVSEHRQPDCCRRLVNKHLSTIYLGI